MGEVGRIHLLSGQQPVPAIAITLESHDETGQAAGAFYQIVFYGLDATALVNYGVRGGDTIVVSVEDLEAKAYVDVSKSPPRPVGYFECRGRDPFPLSFRQARLYPDPNGSRENRCQDPPIDWDPRERRLSSFNFW
jgi:hypothetical protein